MGQAITRRYRVEGMVCAACQATVERTAMRLAQVSSAQASANKGTLEVTYAVGVDVDATEVALGQAILDSGYELVGGCAGKPPVESTERARMSQPASLNAHSVTPHAAGSTAHAEVPQSAEPATRANTPQSAARAGASQPAGPAANAGTRQAAGSAAHAGASQSAASAARANAPQSTAHAGASQPAGPTARASVSQPAESAAPTSTSQPAASTNAPQSAARANAPQSTAPAGTPQAVGPTARDALTSLLILATIGATLLVAHALGLTDVFLAFPTVGSATTYPALFVVGLFTSLHCVAMCGGLNLSQSLVGPAQVDAPSKEALSPQASRRHAALHTLRPNALYNLGRLISYSAIGGVLGLLGSAFVLSAQARAVIGVAAGAFMVAMGLTLMGILRPGVLSRLLPRGAVRKVASATSALRQRGPFLLGLVNGLMPCGPLQAMQVYAVTTGSAAAGALSLFVFCLGTVPLMFVAGSVISALKARWRRGLMRVGGAMLVVFGLVATSNGAALLGIDTFGALQHGSGAVVAATGADGVQRATIEVDYGSYQDVRLKAGVPAELAFHVPEDKLIGCNSSLSIPAFGVHTDLSTGDTVVSFTPTQAGTYPYACWMGMIKATITVEE